MMALFTENKILTKAVRYEFPNKTWTLSGLNYHIRKKIGATDSVKRRRDSETKSIIR